MYFSAFVTFEILSSVGIFGFDDAFLVTYRPKTGTFNHAYVQQHIAYILALV